MLEFPSARLVVVLFCCLRVEGACLSSETLQADLLWAWAGDAGVGVRSKSEAEAFVAADPLEAWISAYSTQLPGYAHSAARRCPRREPHEAADGRAWRAASSVARARRRAQWHVRADWVAQRLDEWFAASPLAEATVAEIGPCNAPVRFEQRLAATRSVRRVVIDFTDDMAVLNMSCFHADARVDVVSDAQTLAVVRDGAFDSVMAFHVLEHMPDALGALSAWLRVLKPGGLLFVGVPDGCGRTQNSDRARPPADADHHLDERRAALRDARAEKHNTSSADTARVARARLNDKALRSSASTHFAENALSWATLMLVTFLDANMPDAAREARAEAPCAYAPLYKQPLAPLLEWARERTRDTAPFRMHFHTWTAATMTDMLNVASKHRALLKIPPFQVVDIVAAPRTVYQMPELHVALRRL